MRDKDDEIDMNVGKPVYPVGWKNEEGDNVDVPENQRHSFSRPLFFSPDSKALIFADYLEEKSSVVFISIQDSGETVASVRSFPAKLGCAAASGPRSGKPTAITNVDFGPDQGSDRILFIKFKTEEGCDPPPILMRLSDAKPALWEKRVIAKPTRGQKVSK